MFRKEFEPLLQQKTRVVILGAGFAGLEAAKTLKRAPVEITLIDRHNYHCFQPLLYQVATAALSPADIAWPVRHILRSQENATVFMAEVIGIDGDLRVVKTPAGEFPVDFLVIATGAVHSYFGHENWAAVAPGLKRIEDATRIRRSILSAFEQAELIRDDAERKRLLTFVIIGDGPTGVEMAGAIAEVARQTLARDFRRIDPRTARIVLIEAGPRLLPNFTEQHSSYARDTLTAMGVDVMTSSAMSSPTTASSAPWGGAAISTRDPSDEHRHSSFAIARGLPNCPADCQNRRMKLSSPRGALCSRNSLPKSCTPSAGAAVDGGRFTPSPPSRLEARSRLG